MPFGSEFSEKLTLLLGATALCCFGSALPTGIVEHAAVEAMLGAAGLGVFLARMRRSKAGALVRRCVREVEPGIDALLAREYHNDPDPEARRKDALNAVQAVLPLIEPQPEDYVTARLSRDGVVAFYLARDAAKQPSRFGADAEDTLPRRLLEAVIGNAWRRILEQPEFRDNVAFETLRELLIGQDELREEFRQGHREIRDDVAGVPDATAERVIAALEARGIVRKAEQAGLERQAMIRIAGRLRPDENLDFDQAVVEVEHAVGIALEVIARGERGGNLDAFVETVLRRLAETTRAGDFDRGSLAVDDALRELARREAEQRDAMRRSRTALLEAGIEQDTLRRDAPAVARRIEALVALEQRGDLPAWTLAFRHHWDALFAEGSKQGINFSLEVAAALARLMLDGASDSGKRGVAGNLLGVALQTIGERESDNMKLKQAVEAFNIALEANTREHMPLQWAGTQANLGNVLRMLGARESDIARTERAVTACRAALQEYTREREPLGWAQTQNNLGAALAILGERETTTTLLEQAAAAFGAALEVYTRAQVPLQWAMVQHNLGSVLQILGEREAGTARLRQAIEAHRAAFSAYTRERAPVDWAGAQHSLGTALQVLGQRESDMTLLGQAITAFRSALEERTRERMPYLWAMTQNNLGNTLAMLGDREGGTERLEQAVVAYRAVLEEYTRERMPPHWATTQHNLGNVLAMLGTRKSSVPLLEQAIEAYRSALVERPRESAPLNWADSQRGLAGALASLATRRPGRRLGLPCNAPTGPRAYGRRVGLYARRCGGVSGRLQSLLVGNDRAADQRARDDAGGHAKRGGLIRMKADPMLTLVTKVTDGGVTVKSMLPAAFVPFTGG